MDLETFRTSLKRAGRKEHVVEKLIDDVKRFHRFLRERRKHGIDDATPNDLESYAVALETAKPGSAKISIRGLALYYDAAGDSARTSLAAGIREQAVAKTRKVFALGDFRGVNQSHVAKLRTRGIADVHQMLEAATTPEARRKLAGQTGVPLRAILELVKLSDLSRLPGVKGIRARLYHDAGVDTLEKMAQWEPGAQGDAARVRGAHGIRWDRPIPRGSRVLRNTSEGAPQDRPLLRGPEDGGLPV